MAFAGCPSTAHSSGPLSTSPRTDTQGASQSLSGLSRLSGSFCSQGRPLAWAAGHWTWAGHLVALVLGWLHPALFSTGSLDTGCAHGCDLSLTCRGSWGLWAQTAQGDLGLWRPETLGAQTPVCVQACHPGLGTW